MPSDPFFSLLSNATCPLIHLPSWIFEPPPQCKIQKSVYVCLTIKLVTTTMPCILNDSCNVVAMFLASVLTRGTYPPDQLSQPGHCEYVQGGDGLSLVQWHGTWWPVVLTSKTQTQSRTSVSIYSAAIHIRQNFKKPKIASVMIELCSNYIFHSGNFF